MSSVFRVEKNKNYTTISNYHFRDKRLSLKAKGLLSIMLSLPEDWDYTEAGLVSICKEGRDCVGATLRELESNGYLTRTRLQDKKTGQFGDMDYTVYEYPITENPPQGFPTLEKPTQLNTNLTNKLNNKDSIPTGIDKDSTHKPKKFNASELFDHVNEVFPKQNFLEINQLLTRYLELRLKQRGPLSLEQFKILVSNLISIGKQAGTDDVINQQACIDSVKQSILGGKSGIYMNFFYPDHYARDKNGRTNHVDNSDGNERIPDFDPKNLTDRQF